MEYVRLLPKNTLSRVIGKLARTNVPFGVSAKARDWFIKRYQINMNEAEKPINSYKTVGDLFVRKLKPGVRPIGSGPVHPCDGELTRVGVLEEAGLLQTKGIRYSLNTLLQDDKAEDTFGEGAYLTYYLCPTDYHRVHAPMDMDIIEVTHVPGRLWPVNPWSVENISQLFCINERVVFRGQTPLGPVAVVMIGATNVGDIEVVFDEGIRTNVSNNQLFRRKYVPPVKRAKGEELGVFHMGSSVIVIYPQRMLSLLPEPGSVRMGASL